jgi:hypothetical protein
VERGALVGVVGKGWGTGPDYHHPPMEAVMAIVFLVLDMILMCPFLLHDNSYILGFTINCLLVYSPDAVWQ